MKNKRILSGMRPSGKLHLGHLAGALKNWIKFQEEAECFYMVADWHALTTEYQNTKGIKDNIKDMVVDWIAAGIDPKKSVIFVQSKVCEHAELHLILSMIVSIARLERVPSYKDIQQELSNKDLSTYGFLGYPVLQAGDILLYKTNFVPVGEDQLPHIELTRELAKKFNSLYKEVLTIPKGILTETPRLPGLDGRKMSKSYGNSIYLSDNESAVSKKVMTMITDPQRIKRDDPGHPDICIVYAFHKIYSVKEIDKIAENCISAKIGCTDCKKDLVQKLIEVLKPINEKRKELLSQKDLVDMILENGNAKAKKVAGKTLDEVKEAIGF
ncbi:MAG: tryptophan--tRNA ligase [bacterium]|nr:tryptophan--tRNA ligase [bacterium]